jgi:hypothetical protein
MIMLYMVALEIIADNVFGYTSLLQGVNANGTSCPGWKKNKNELR